MQLFAGLPLPAQLPRGGAWVRALTSSFGIALAKETSFFVSVFEQHSFISGQLVHFSNDSTTFQGKQRARKGGPIPYVH